MRSALGRRAAILATTITITATPLLAQTISTTDPLLGTWQLNNTKSAFNRGLYGGAPVSRTWTYEIVGDGVRHIATSTTSFGGDAKVTIRAEYVAKIDGKEYQGAGFTGSSDEERRASTFSLKRIDARTVQRTAKISGVPREIAVYSVSADGQVMTCTSWTPETPDKTNIQVFDRVNGAAGR
jgi:hypothetical protein